MQMFYNSSIYIVYGLAMPTQSCSHIAPVSSAHALFLGSLHPQLLGRAVEDLKQLIPSSGY